MPRSAFLAERLARLLAGLVLYGTGIALMVRAGVGLSPWDVLAQGVSLRSGLPFGLVTNLIGAVVLIAWIPLRQLPGPGTLLNVLLVGTTADVALGLIPEAVGIGAEVVWFVAGLTAVAVATGLYLGARLGPGPRDGLMTGLVARSGWPVWVVRTAIEVGVVVLGAALGGDVGAGTLVFALMIGPMVQPMLAMLTIRPEMTRVASHRTVDEMIA